MKKMLVLVSCLVATLALCQVSFAQVAAPAADSAVPAVCTCPHYPVAYPVCPPQPTVAQRLAARRAARFATPSPYPFPPAVPQAACTAHATYPELATPGYVPPQFPPVSPTAGKNAFVFQRSGAPIVINFLSVFRTQQPPYYPYAGYYNYPPLGH
jgi:hypothetical protein